MEDFIFDVNGIMFRPKKIIKKVADDINLKSSRRLNYLLTNASNYFYNVS